MSLTFKDSKNAIPIAKIKGSDKIVYILDESNVFPDISAKNSRAKTFKCPYCKKEIKNKGDFIYHVTHDGTCPKKNKIAMDTKPAINLSPLEFMQPLPLPLEEHNVMMVTGVPKCGKSYWVNEYVKAFKQMYNRPVFRISRVEHDATLNKDMDKYINIPVTNDLVEDPIKMEDLSESLVVFDDIESSEFKKATDKVYALMDDIAKAGRHHKIDCLFVNQESRMAKKTKVILSCLTHIVIFPKSGSVYQYSRLLNEQLGLSKNETNKILDLNSRWVMISRAKPMYVLHEHGAYMIGKEIFD